MLRSVETHNFRRSRVLTHLLHGAIRLDSRWRPTWRRYFGLGNVTCQLFRLLLLISVAARGGSLSLREVRELNRHYLTNDRNPQSEWLSHHRSFEGERQRNGRVRRFFVSSFFFSFFLSNPRFFFFFFPVCPSISSFRSRDPADGHDSHKGSAEVERG